MELSTMQGPHQFDYEIRIDIHLEKKIKSFLKTFVYVLVQPKIKSGCEAKI